MIALLKRLFCLLLGHILNPVWKSAHSARLAGWECERCRGVFRK